MYNCNLHRPHKSAARYLANVSVDPATQVPADNAIFLTTPELYDVKLCLEQRQIKKTTNLIIFEKDKKRARLLEAALKKAGFKHFSVYSSKIEDSSLGDILKTGQLIDFAFLDLCGQLTAPVSVWLMNNLRYFRTGASVAITLATQVRKNYFLEMLSQSGDWEQVAKQLPPRHTSLLATHEKKWTQATIFGAVASIARVRHAEITEVFEYHDSSPMVMIRFRIREFRKYTARTSKAVRDTLLQLSGLALRSRAYKSVRTYSGGSILPWQALGCKASMTAGRKTAYVVRARNGHRPYFLSPAKWAHCPMNPRGIRHPSREVLA